MAAIACVVQRKRGLKKVAFLRFHSKYSSQCLYKLVLRLKYSSVPRKSFLGGFFDQRIFDGSVVDLITSQLSFSERRHAVLSDLQGELLLPSPDKTDLRHEPRVSCISCVGAWKTRQRPHLRGLPEVPTA